jgi:hypothetical protein
VESQWVGVDQVAEVLEVVQVAAVLEGLQVAAVLEGLQVAAVVMVAERVAVQVVVVDLLVLEVLQVAAVVMAADGVAVQVGVVAVVATHLPPLPPPGVHGTGPRDGPIIVNAQLDLTIWAALCDITGKYPLQAWEFPIRCKGCMCSTSRRVWRCCVALVIPPASIDLDVLFSIYPYFVEDRNSPVSIRAALYYMYATEVYESVGFGNRMQFGICLVTAIRNAYPNLKSKVR